MRWTGEPVELEVPFVHASVESGAVDRPDAYYIPAGWGHIADKLRLLNRVITNLYDENLREAGITTAQMNILTVVAKYGTASPGQVGGRERGNRRQPAPRALRSHPRT